MSLYRPKAIAALHEFTKHFAIQGRGYIILIATKVGDRETFSYHPRIAQPCLGGETRKYRWTHGSFCTQDEDKPTDLYDPFPEHGLPVGISYVTKNIKNEDMLRAYMVPFARGLPVNGDGEPALKHEVVNGSSVITLGSGDFDPTVSINFFQTLRSWANAWDESCDTRFKALVDAGFNPSEIALIAYYNGGLHTQIRSEQGAYYHAPNLSFKRFLKGDPRSLSGGLWSEGYDYNRSDVQDLFHEEGAPDFDELYKKHIKDRESEYNYATREMVSGNESTLEEWVAGWRNLINEGLATEPDYPEFKLEVPAPVIPKLVTKYVEFPHGKEGYEQNHGDYDEDYEGDDE